jgi:hypothetical protein
VGENPQRALDVPCAGDPVRFVDVVGAVVDGGLVEAVIKDGAVVPSVAALGGPEDDVGVEG